MNAFNARFSTLLLAAAVVASCADDPTATSTSTASTGGARTPGTLAQQQPATPPPGVVPSPKGSAELAGVATPTPVVLPSPIMPASPQAAEPSASPTAAAGASASPTASASPGTTSPSPGASASPVPAGYTKTNVATDLAVSGPGYFVLATKPNPSVLEDLYYTRNGHFKLVKENVDGGPAQWRLKHTTSDFYVVGFAITPGRSDAPDETSGISEALLNSQWGGTAVSAVAVSLDAGRNPDAATKLSFSNAGRVSYDGNDPFASDGVQRVASYVGLVQFEHPEHLVAQPGIDGVYRFAADAGRIFLGVSVTGLNRPVGNNNRILVGTLEGS